jgi:hypothetical protein
MATGANKQDLDIQKQLTNRIIQYIDKEYNNDMVETYQKNLLSIKTGSTEFDDLIERVEY